MRMYCSGYGLDAMLAGIPRHRGFPPFGSPPQYPACRRRNQHVVAIIRVNRFLLETPTINLGVLMNAVNACVHHILHVSA